MLSMLAVHADPLCEITFKRRDQLVASFRVEIANSEEERRKGLMGRRMLAAGQGMLFKFETARSIAMWMKDTPLSLDMVFINAERAVTNIVSSTAPMSLTPIPSLGPVRYVLEINQQAADVLRQGDKLIPFSCETVLPCHQSTSDCQR